MKMTSHSKYGLGQFGKGTGNYTPVSGFTTRENTLLNNAIRHVRNKYKHLNIFILKLHGGGYQRSGIPDVYIALAGKSIWVEFKRPGADTTALQKSTLEKLDKAGVYCGTADGVNTLVEIIEEVLNDKTDAVLYSRDDVKYIYECLRIYLEGGDSYDIEWDKVKKTVQKYGFVVDEMMFLYDDMNLPEKVELKKETP